jgi:branched-chain amino acid transport system permease protein
VHVPEAVIRYARSRGPSATTLAGTAVAVGSIYAIQPRYDGTFFLSFLIDVVILGLAAMGLQHMVGDAGVLNLGQAAFFGLGAYGGVWTLQHWGWTTLPAFGAAIVVAAAGAVVMAPLLRLRGVYFAMASFAFGAMMFEIFGQAVSLTILGHSFVSNGESYLVCVTVALVCYAMLAWLARSGYGLSLHAVRQSENGARAAGVNVARLRFFALLIGVVPAALAGVLYAQVHGIVQAGVFDYNQSVALITMVIVGGVASRWGAFAGALLAQYVAVYPRTIEQYRFLLYGLLIAALMIVLPGGIASLGRIATHRARMLRRRAPA